MATNATIRLLSCVFSNNIAQGGDIGEGPVGALIPGGKSFGGAIFIDGGELMSANTVFVSNRAKASEYPDTIGRTVEFSDSHGGAISVNGSISTISGCNFTFNRAVTGGGAIHSQSTELIVENSIFHTNSVVARTFLRLAFNPEGDGRGGALEAVGLGSSIIRDSSFKANQISGGGREVSGSSSSLSGGAIFSQNEVEIRRCEFLANLVQGDEGVYAPPIILRGGAICVESAATVSDSRFANNAVIGGDGHWNFNSEQDPSLAGSAYGGAMYVVGALSLEASSCVSNAVVGGNVPTTLPASFLGKAVGSAIYASNSVFATNVTIALNVGRDNTSNGLAGAVYFTGAGATLLTNRLIYCTFATNESRSLGGQNTMQVLHASIAANVVVSMQGTILSGGTSNTVSGQIEDLGFNLSSDSLFSDETSKNSIDVKLGPMGHYGGKGETVPVLRGSPAIDAVLTGGIATDQRGRVRPAGAVDIGAYELSPPFVAAGRITPGVNLDQVSLTASGNPVQVNPLTGEFVGLFSATGVLKPSLPGVLFFPEEISLENGTEIFNAAFTGYRFNEVAVEMDTGPNLTLTFAAESAGTYRLQYSGDLNTWSDGETRAVAANSLFRTEVPSGIAPQFFRVAKQ